MNPGAPVTPGSHPISNTANYTVGQFAVSAMGWAAAPAMVSPSAPPVMGRATGRRGVEVPAFRARSGRGRVRGRAPGVLRCCGHRRLVASPGSQSVMPPGLCSCTVSVVGPAGATASSHHRSPTEVTGIRVSEGRVVQPKTGVSAGAAGLRSVSRPAAVSSPRGRALRQVP